MCVCAGGKIDGKLGAALPRGNVIVPVHGANARREFFLTACNVAHEGRKARGVGVFFRLFQQNFRGGGVRMSSSNQSVSSSRSRWAVFRGKI